MAVAIDIDACSRHCSMIVVTVAQQVMPDGCLIGATSPGTR
jgi:hypothetical protein